MYLFVTVYCIYWLRRIPPSHLFGFPFHKSSCCGRKLVICKSS